MNILFTICGRAGSKGIKNKNIRLFNGKLLPYYSISAIDLFLRKTDKDISYDIVLNTDSEQLMEIMRKNQLRDIEIIERTKELSGDTIGKIEVILDCLEKMELKKNIKYDVVVDLDITSPLRKVEDIEKIIDVYNSKNANVVTSITSARRNPFFNQLKKTNHGYKRVIESNYTARQQAPEIYDMNASIYAYNPHYLRTGKGVFDGYMECVEMYDTGILDLDHENDFELMEVIASYLINNNDKFSEIFYNIK